MQVSGDPGEMDSLKTRMEEQLKANTPKVLNFLSIREQFWAVM